MSYRDTETNEKIPMDGTFYGVPDRRFVTPDDAGAFFRDSEATTLSLGLLKGKGRRGKRGGG